MKQPPTEASLALLEAGRNDGMKTQSPDRVPSGRSAQMSGAEALVETLKAQETEVIFGLIGATIMDAYDALHRDGTLRHIMAGHEQGATHMAEGFARVTGRPGVVLATSGPGATNLVTGIANAMMDSIPLVAITGQVPTSLIGNDAFQEADMHGISMPITKHNYTLNRVDELPRRLAEAFYLAAFGRPGPVQVDLPKDVSQASTKAEIAGRTRPAGFQPPDQGHPRQIQRALSLLKDAQRPVILAGGGVIHAEASQELLGLAERLDLPVTSTLMGLGGFPGNHRLWLGMAGMHGLAQANLALYHCDVMLCVGTRLEDRLTGPLDKFAPQARLIHIDIDTTEIGKNRAVAVPIVGHAKPILTALLAGAQKWEPRPDHSAWHRRIEDWRRRHPLGYRSKDEIVMPQQVVEELGHRLDEEAIIVTGVGQHQMWTAQHYRFTRPRTMITAGGLGTMGFGLPAAIGAKIGRPERNVVCLDGDGSFLMTIQELTTAVRYRLPVVVVVINNSSLGMVRQWQELFFEGRYAETRLSPPPYDQVARAFGALGRRVERPEALGPALDWALAASQEKQLPAVVDIQVDPEECVLPMMSPGGAAKNFIHSQV